MLPSNDILTLLLEQDIVHWLETHFWIRNPRDPETGENLGRVGRIKIAQYQQPVLRETQKRLPDGKLKYSTVVWSEPKKSAKSTLGAGVALFKATSVSDCQIYCLANDGRQSRDREYLFVRRAIESNAANGGIFRGVVPGRNGVELANGSIIQAIAVDPSGEAGGEPLMTIWGELHGYRQSAKLKLYAEMTIPPTLYGEAQRWIESYAGYEGESPILEQLYEIGVEKGTPHPDLPDCYINTDARQFTFWSHVGRMAWHTKEYYDEERAQLTIQEFSRMHQNMWISSKQTFVLPAEWEACKNEQILALDPYAPLIVALDASVSGTAFAVVATSASVQPGIKTAERFTLIIEPGEVGGRINYTRDVEPVLKHLWAEYKIMAFVYDPFQLHKLATDLSDSKMGLWLEFPQGQLRVIADTLLRQMIIDREIEHRGAPELTAHIKNAAAKPTGPDGKLVRIIKKTDDKDIDGAVALSMANFVSTLIKEQGESVLYLDDIRVTMGY